ncbi:four-carbon acid sugar kinase family protein [soil metagenome]
MQRRHRRDASAGAVVLVVADDLTGANATAARFARRGLRAVTVSDPARLDGLREDYDVLVCNTASRHREPTEAARLVEEALAAAGPVRLVVKRTDTTLRGNVGAEVAAALSSLRRHRAEPVRALMVPAFPEAGRTTVGGLQLVDGVALSRTDAARDPYTPVASSRVADILRAQADLTVAEVPLDVVLEAGEALSGALDADVDVLVCDAVDRGDLAAAAAAAARVGGVHWLSVDSGPFGAELAGALGLAGGEGPPPLLVVAGSVTATTRDQMREVEQVLGARLVTVEPRAVDPEPLARRLAELVERAPPGGVVGVRTSGGPDDVVELTADEAARVPPALGAAVSRALESVTVSGLYLTGGDVTVGVVEALGASGVEVDEEVLPLAVAGRLVGGPHEGLPVVTKGGLVGGRGAAVACLDHLRSRVS